MSSKRAADSAAAADKDASLEQLLAGASEGVQTGYLSLSQEQWMRLVADTKAECLSWPEARKQLREGFVRSAGVQLTLADSSRINDILNRLEELENEASAAKR